MKINVEAVLAREAERKAQPVSLPKIRIKGNPDLFYMALKNVPESVKRKVDKQIGVINERSKLLDELNTDFVNLKKARAILSSQTWKLVKEIEERLRKENPASVDVFLEGNLPMKELEDHAAKIEALTDQGAKIFDDIRYAEQHGKLPSPVDAIPSEALTEDVKAIHYEIRRLDDRIHKTKKKLELQRAKNPARLATWNQKIALDEAKRTDLKHKLKKLQYESRAERSGE